MKTNVFNYLLPLLLSLLLSLAPSASGQTDRLWTGATSNNWTEAGNWSVEVADSTSEAAHFSGTPYKGTVKIGDSFITIGQIKVTDVTKQIVIDQTNTGTGSLTLNSSGYDGVGIDMSAAEQALVIKTTSTGTASLALNLGSSQEWRVTSATSAANLTINSAVSNAPLAVGLGSHTLTTNVGSGRTISLGGANITVTGTGGSIVKTGAGDLDLDGSNSYNGGTIVSNGNLLVLSDSALGNGNVVLESATGGQGNLKVADGVNVGQALTISNTGDRKVLRADSGSAEYSGNISIEETTSGHFVIQAIDGATLTISGDISGVSGDAGISKWNPGTLILTGTNTYTGSTKVTNGTLVVGDGASGSLGASALTVQAGATLLGAGLIGGATTIGQGGKHSAGVAGAGTQTFTDDLTYSDGSIFAWDLGSLKDSSDGVRGTDYDAVNVAGTLAGLDGDDLNITTDAVFRVVLAGGGDLAESFWDMDHAWTDIFKTADAGAAISFASIFGGGFEYYNADGVIVNGNTTGRSFTLTGSTLNWSVVPEPSGLLAGMLIVAGICRRRRNSEDSIVC